MKLLFISGVLTVLLFTNSIYSQSFSIKLKESKLSKPEPPLHKKADLPILLYFLGIASLISPMVVFEDKRVFFALTKEVSLGKFPYGRLSFEYSYVFRDSNTSHLRFSYNYDIILSAADFIAFIASPGAGYFTDTKNKGWFLHGSAGALFVLKENIGLNPYLRYRHTFIDNKLKSDIDDISLGAALIFYF
jgi:hypothetical protein